MVWTSDHACERFKKRGDSKLSDIQIKKFISDSIVKWEPTIRQFNGGTVKIPDTSLKAVCEISDTNQVVVVTVISNNMYGGSYDNKPMQENKKCSATKKRRKKI